MTVAKRFAFALALTFSVLLITVRAQTPQMSTVNISPDSGKVHVSTIGDVYDMRVEVSNESGEVVFESGAVVGNNLDWNMRDSQGGRVSLGTYTVSVSYRTQAGKLMKRVEQVTVTEAVTTEDGQGKTSVQTNSPPPANVVGPIDGEGTVGRIARFTATNTIGDSIIAESANRLVINTEGAAPNAVLQVNGLQPTPVAGNGTNATMLLSTTGGEGGDTTGTTNQTAGAGATVSLIAGNGGDAPAGSNNGKGGNVILQPGSAGDGAGTPGQQGNVLMGLAGVGNVGIATNAPTSKLTVNGMIQTIGAGGGLKFPDGSVQTSATSGTITGTGTTGQIVKFTGPNSFGNSVIKESAGNVGIGTATPARPLEIANGKLRFSSNLGDIEFTETADLIAHATTVSPAANLPAFRVDTGTNLTRVFTVMNNGKVGIGASAPAAMLEIRGDGSTFLLRVFDSQGKDAFKVVNNGVVSFGALYSLSSTSHLCYHAPSNLALTTCSSAAEYVPTVDNGSGFPETADLVSIAPTRANPYGDAHAPFVVQKSATACDDQLLGYIVKPESGADGQKKNEHYLPLAIYGYFPAKVTTENGAIKRGDPVTSSSRPGYGMKATGACKIIGYALEDANREGKIQVFANSREYAAPQVKALQAQVEELRSERETEVEALMRENAAIKARLEMLERAAMASAANRQR